MYYKRVAAGLLSLAFGLCAFSGTHALSLGLHDLAYRQRMDNNHDLQYFGNVTLGRQEIRAILDTGSIEFVVISDRCTYWCGNAEHLYHSNSSATHRMGSLAQVLSYGSGDLEVREAYDDIQIGPFRGIFAPFWETVDANMALLLRSSFQAIIGLGPIAPTTKVMQYTASSNSDAFAPLQKVLHIDRFSVCLLKEPGSHGFVTWRDDHVSRKPEFFTKLTIPDTGYWMVKLQDVKLGNRLIGCAAGCGAVIDSGTSLIAAIWPRCNEKGSGGDLTNTTSRHFEFISVGPQPSRSCGAALMHISVDSDFGDVWILGMPFFRKFYSVFTQLTPQSPAAVYTAVADPQCFPANHSPSQLLGGHLKQRPRRIDVTKLQVPPWAAKSHGQGKLSNSHSLPPLRWLVDDFSTHSDM